MAPRKKGEPPNQKKSGKRAIIRPATRIEKEARAKARAKKGTPPNKTRTPRGSGTSANENRKPTAMIRQPKPTSAILYRRKKK